MGGLVSYGAYVPYHRLERGRIAGVLGSGGGRGTRSVAGYDEDTTSMAVEAGRAALTGRTGPRAERESLRQLFFATAVPAYADKTNATAVHAALRLPSDALAVDLAGAVRSGVGALIAAAQSPVPAMAATARPRSSSAGTTTACRYWPRSSGRAPPPRSSWTGGGRQARPPRGCGKNGSASRCTGRWPTRR